MKKRLPIIFTLLAVCIIFTTGKAQREMILVEGGTFQMGNPFSDNEKKGDPDEKPVHSVTISDFYIGKTEVTVKDYKEYSKAKSIQMPAPPNEEWMDEHPETKKFYTSPQKTWWGWVDEYPMHNLTWFDAIAYCNWLSEKEGLEKVYSQNADFGWEIDLTKNGYRLPTEAEWEFAARGGTKSKGTRFSGSDSPESVAWYDETTNVTGPQKVGTKAPNELGIFDMSGNVWEWCCDYYSAGYYKNSPATNPLNATPSPYKVLRGGGWHYQGSYGTVTSRDGPEPSYTNYNYGFRLARTKK